jgi:hypothetical protein
MAWFGLLTPQNQLENLVSPMNRRKELIAILIGVILFFVSVVPTLRGGFDFKNDYINIAFAATSSIVITLLIIMLYHLSDLRQDFESKREIPKDKEMSELIELFIGSYINIRNSGDDFFKNRLNDVRNEFKIAISDLKNGHIVFEDSKRWECFILDMTRLLEDEDTLKATSHVIIPEWWDSEFGKRYIEENKNAIHKKKVKITRLFFVDENKVGDYAEKIKEHRDAAVEVRIIIMNDLNPAQIEDFMIAGEKYVVYVDLYEGKIKKVHVYNTQIEIDRANGLFSDLEMRSKGLENFEEFND